MTGVYIFLIATFRPSFGNLNYFGGKSATPLRDSKRLKQHLVGNPDEMFVFLSDVWLDHSQVNNSVYCK